MSVAKAHLRSLRISPRKVRLVADAVRGVKVEDALVKLSFLTKGGSLPIKKLVQSAVANAKNKGISSDSLFIEKIAVDEGKILYRHMPRARGSAYQIRKRTSHIAVELGDLSEVVAKKK